MALIIRKSIEALVVFLLFSAFLSKPNFFNWHDWHRVLQVTIFFLASVHLVIAVRFDGFCFRFSSFFVFVLFVFFGLGSIVFSNYPMWALREVSVFIGCVAFVVFIIKLFRSRPDFYSVFFAIFFRAVSGLVAYLFLIDFLIAVSSQSLYFSIVNFVQGFSNPRHQGQFLTLLAPLMLAPIANDLEVSSRGRVYLRGLDFLLLVMIVALVFVTGTRGTIAAWGMVSIILFLKKEFRYLALRMLIALFLGYFLAWAMLSIISMSHEQVVEYRFGSTALFGLSAREILWMQAVSVIIDSPWIGIGPMHLAALDNPIANHPHQSVLQIAAEWGVIVALIFMAVVARFFFLLFDSATKSVGGQRDLVLALLFSLSSSAVQSMVDGVLVMPYVQLWLALIVAIAFFQLSREVGKDFCFSIPVKYFLFIFISVSIYLLLVLVNDFDIWYGAAEFCQEGPRFWCKGSIVR
jgi:O-antigen ligase